VSVSVSECECECGSGGWHAYLCCGKMRVEGDVCLLVFISFLCAGYVYRCL